MYASIIITAIISISVVVITVGAITQDYKLKKEQIKADAMVKAEEVKAKNQMEIEKLYIANNKQAAMDISDYNDEICRRSARERL